MEQRIIALMSLMCVLTTFIAAAALAKQPQANPPQAKTVHAQPTKSLAEKTQRARTIAELEAYLSRITTLKAQFNQVAPDGSIAHGTFTLKRPGKMRWDYAPPTPLLLVSDGDTITFYDADLGQVTYVDMDDTLAGFLARKDVLLNSPAVELTHFTQQAGVIKVTLVQKTKPKDGSLTLEFKENPLTLSFMNVTDASGNMTRVQLQQAQYGIPVADNIFVFSDPRGVIRKRR